MAGETVTIGLISFNAADTLERALASALAQTHAAIEVLIVDDASTDETPALAQRLVEAHPGIRLIRRASNGGAAAARNDVIAEARGAFIAFFDDDDVSDARRVELQLRRLTEYERRVGAGIVVCHTARHQRYPDGTLRTEPTMGANLDEPAPQGFAVARRILAGTPLRNGYGSVATCSQLARTDTLRRLGGFDPHFRRSQDTELCIRLAKAGAHFVGIAEPLVEQTMTRTSDKSIERERQNWLMLADKHRDVFVSEGERDACRRWINLRHDWLSRQRGAFWKRLFLLGLVRPGFTAMRAWMSLRNLRANAVFSRFHLGR
jgi:glycosyltransferase involved in cell wall biosynthesis